LKILLVEDHATDLELTGNELRRLGHVVLPVTNGAEALELFDRSRPDVVITDIFMPGMDGFALIHAVQKRALPHWQPVILLSGLNDQATQRQALATGADAFVTKPVVAADLESRLLVIERLLRLQQEARQRAVELEHYYAAEEEDKRIARHLIDRLMNVDKLDDPAIRLWLMPSGDIGGDLVANARTPAGVLHVMVADGTGHGLAASINVLPVAAPFYSMTQKGFGIETIVRELNIKVRQFLPVDRFVALTLATIDFREGLIKVWNGGNPEPFLLRSDGHAERVFTLGHLPLGVLPDDEFDSSFETQTIDGSSQLVLYTDGLIKTRNRAGEPFGVHRLTATLVHAEAGNRLASIIDAVTNHLGESPADDDISVLLINCVHEKETIEPPTDKLRVAVADPGKWQFSLSLGPRELRRIDVVPMLLGLINQFEGSHERSGEVFIVLSELFNNALDHGLLRLDSSLKAMPDGMERYLDERSRRLAGLADGEIEITVRQVITDDRAWLHLCCRDSGPGFDYRPFERTSLPIRDDQPYGRGLYLVRSLCSQLEFKGRGNEITAIIALEH